MKSEDEIRKRLENLRKRYLKKYLSGSQTRRCFNCSHSYLHSPTGVPKEPPLLKELELAPRQSKTLVVLQEESPIYLCLLGSEDSATWSGDICDDTVAASCKHFNPRIPAEDVVEEFKELLKDDRYVYDNYLDIATLQWVLGDRIFQYDLSWFGRFVMWIKIKLIRVQPPAPQLSDPGLPSDLWDDTTKNSGA